MDWIVIILVLIVVVSAVSASAIFYKNCCQVYSFDRAQGYSFVPQPLILTARIPTKLQLKFKPVQPTEIEPDVITILAGYAVEDSEGNQKDYHFALFANGTVVKIEEVPDGALIDVEPLTNYSYSYTYTYSELGEVGKYEVGKWNSISFDIPSGVKRIWIGGKATTDANPQANSHLNFKGCLKDIYYNSKEIIPNTKQERKYSCPY